VTVVEPVGWSGAGLVAWSAVFVAFVELSSCAPPRFRVCVGLRLTEPVGVWATGPQLTVSESLKNVLWSRLPRRGLHAARSPLRRVFVTGGVVGHAVSSASAKGFEMGSAMKPCSGSNRPRPWFMFMAFHTASAQARILSRDSAMLLSRSTLAPRNHGELRCDPH